MLKFSIHIARHTAYLLMRLARLGLLLLFVSTVGAILLSRYYLLPHIEEYHDQVTYALGNAFGRPVTIGRIEADWHGFRPHLLMVNVRFKDREGVTALALDKVESEVAWTSLFTGQLRFYSLMLDQPDLSVKRDANGHIFVAGLAMAGGASSNGSAADWLLNQSRIEVRDARISWQDDARSTPPLVFNEVNLLIENGWWRHRFAFRALPPSELSAQVDVRGDFHGTSFDDMSDWRGQLFAQLDYADVAAWRAWLPMPIPLRSGKGALRGWLDVDQGKISAVTADLALSDVRTRLADDLPTIDLRTLHGRVGWRDVARGMEVSTRNLSLHLRNGFVLSPTDFYLRYTLKEQGRATGVVRANKLDLLGLSTLSDYLPFNPGFKRKLAAFDPRGKVSDLYADWDWQGDADKLLRFKLQGRFVGMAMKRVGNIPGFSGLTGRVDGTEVGGDLTITSRKLTLDVPKDILPEKIRLDTLSAQVGWETGWRGVEVKFSNVSFANPDMEGVLNGSYHTVSGSPGAVNMTAHLTRAVVKNVDRYLPVPTVGEDAHAWLARGLVAGSSDDVDVRLSGDLAKFPFPDRKDGQFLVLARLKDATVDFLKDWPRIENINGDLRIDGTRLSVNAPAATTLGNPLQNVSVVIPDLTSPALSLQVYGESLGNTGRALEYTRKSPVRGLLGGFTDSATATGKGQLKLSLSIPLVGGRPVRVDGSYRLMGNDVDLGEGIPLLQQARGDIRFTERSVRTHNVEVTTLGGPARLDVQSSDDGRIIRVRAAGTSDMDAMRAVSTQPVLRYLHGGSPWELGVTAEGGLTRIQFTSSLSGMTSDLPAPFDKKAEKKVPLRFEQTIEGGQRGEINLAYGDLVDAHIVRSRKGGEWRIDNGVVAFGKHGKSPVRKGLWLTGEIPHLSLVGWGPMFAMLGQGASSAPDDTGIAGMELRIGRVTGFRQSVDNLRIDASSARGKLTAHLHSRELNGDVAWEPRGDGLLTVYLHNLALSNGAHKEGSAVSGGGEGKPVPVRAKVSHEDSPDIHLTVANFSYQGKMLGRLELGARQQQGDWALSQVRLTLRDHEGVMTADGSWRASATQPDTRIKFNVQIHDVGRMLTSMGYPNTVQNGKGVLFGDLSWPGGPGDFDSSKLDGTLGLAVDDGEFRKIDPQVSGLLRILSLQAFSLAGAFSDGFRFDSVSGNATIKQGLLSTNNFDIKGAALKAHVTGDVDLNNERQKLKIVVEPAVSGSAALLVAAILNPGIALEFWIVNKFFKGPVEKVVSVTFNVSGTWKDPIVSKEGDKKAPTAGGK